MDRFKASLTNAKTAKDALLKSALIFETSSEESVLDLLRKKQSEQRRNTGAALRARMAGFEGLNKSDAISERYTRFKQDIKQFN